MPAKKKTQAPPLSGAALIKEVCRRIRAARSYWDAHNNGACRGEREKAMALYESLSEIERTKVPQVLRVWLRYRSEKYFGPERTPPGGEMPVSAAPLKTGLHARNRHRDRYDFAQLLACHPPLGAFVAPNAFGDDSIDYSNPNAVKALNGALLRHGYGLAHWDIPPGYLCPPIPGRSDYLHYLADLLAAGRSIPRGKSVRVLDIGTGANCIYPLVGASEYGWSFVGTDIDPAAVRWARQLVAKNPSVAGLIDCRLQSSALECFNGVVLAGECFDLTMSNPPFHASAAEAAAGTRRKLSNLGSKPSAAPALNFGGKSAELWCQGGELNFIRRMIVQSVAFAQRSHWFTTLVSKGSNLPELQQALRHARAAEVRVIEMAQGQKKSRLLAWRFADPL
jgi:23S rRNA (adenine1618-N6)-methyltransferase